MATEFTLPKLGDGVSQGVVVKVWVQEGTRIAPDEPVLEVETDKAIAEVPADTAGTVVEVHVREGDEVAPGDVLFTFHPLDEAQDGATGAADVEGTANDSGPNTAAAPEGDATREEQSPEDDAQSKDDQPEGDGASDDHVPEVVARQEEGPPPGEVTMTGDSEGERRRALVPAAPSTRRFAREIGIDIADVRGSGPAGRISIDDVKAHAKALNEGRRGAAEAASPVGDVALPDFARWGPIARQPLSNVRRTIAQHLGAAWVSIPHVTHFDKADVTELETLRKRFAPRVEEAGGKLTPTVILLKVVAAALERFPTFKSSIDMARGELIMKEYCHIGVAVDTDRGLLVPVVRDVDQKSVVELAVELTEVSQRARQGKLSLEDMQGGTFTISNLGGIGGTGFTPIVNAPEVAILGVARARIEPVWIDGAFVPRTMMPLGVSYDHRVIDGADAARFVRWIVEVLEDPFILFLEG